MIPKPRRPELDDYQRAVDLLCSWLSPRQLQQFDVYWAFLVIGRDTRRTYVITWGRSYNVWRIDIVEPPRLDASLCFLPRAVDLPVPDIMLAQKLGLELFETEALKEAHYSSVMNI